MGSESFEFFLNPNKKFDSDKINNVFENSGNKKRKMGSLNISNDENTLEGGRSKSGLRKSSARDAKNTKNKRKKGSYDGEKSFSSIKEHLPGFAIGPKWGPAGWSKMNKYKSLKLQDEKFYVGDCVFINNSEEKLADDFDFDRFWIAKLLEIRAENGQNVWVMCQWYYKPEELPEGRRYLKDFILGFGGLNIDVNSRYYHGEMELIESDYYEIIAANTISSKVIVKFWDEEKEFQLKDDEENDNSDNKQALDNADDIPEFYWRQRFGGNSTNPKLTRLTSICKCKKYHNPDKILYACYSCKNWLHDECLRKDLIKNGAPDDIDFINIDNKPLIAKSKSTSNEYQVKCLLCHSILI